MSSLVYGEPTATERLAAQARQLLDRYGILTREAALAEGIEGGFAAVYPVLRAMEESGRCRRGYFVAGLGGAQFALPGAVDRLRADRRGSLGDVWVLAATDPANPFGATLPWPKPGDVGDGGRRPSRVPGAYVVTLHAEPALYVERGGKGLVALREPFAAAAEPAPWLRQALQALADHVRRGRLRRLGLERFGGEPVVGSSVESLLVEVGFRQGPRRLTLSA